MPNAVAQHLHWLFLPSNTLDKDLLRIVFPYPDAVHIIPPASLTPTQRSNLSFGLEFISAAHSVQQTQQDILRKARAELNDFEHRIRWRNFWLDGPDEPPPLFHIPKHPPGPMQPELFPFFGRIRAEFHQLQQHPPPLRNEFSTNDDGSPVFRGHETTLPPSPTTAHLYDQGFIIKPADKNLGPVVLTLELYNQETQRQLLRPDFYEALNVPPDVDNLRGRLAPLIEEAKRIDTDMSEFINDHPGKIRPKIPLFYLTIKVHKNPWTGRPIVAATQWITTPLAIIVSHYVRKLNDRYGRRFILTDSTQLINSTPAASSSSQIHARPLPPHRGLQ